MATYDINLRDYWRIFRKKKLIIISTILMMGFFSFTFAHFLKPLPQYRASSSVKVEKTASVAGVIVQAVSLAEGDNLSTQAEIIVSYPIMERVAKELGFIDKNIPSEIIRRDENLLGRVLSLKSQVSTRVEGFTNIITITAITPSPKLSQSLANTTAEVYRDWSTVERNKRIIRAKSFIESQLIKVEKNLVRDEERLREFQKENKLFSIDAQTREALSQLTKAEADYEKVKVQIREINKIKEQLRAQKGLAEPLPGLMYGQFTPSFISLHNSLVDLSIKREGLLELYTEDHPDVLEIDTKIKSTTEAMINELISQEKSLLKQQEILKSELENLRKRFQSLPESSIQLARLERNLKLHAEVYTLLQGRYQESLIAEAEKVEEVTIIKPALEPKSPMNPPKVFLSSFVGTFLGIILGIVFAFISETLDTSIGTIEDVESYLNVPVLGIIPHIDVEDIKDTIEKRSHIEKDEKTLERNARLISHFAPKSPFAESYRSLRTNIQFISLEKGVKSLLFTSATLQEGKTTTAINLAITMAQMGQKTLMVDCDLRRPSVSRFFGIDREPGLTDIILGNSEINETIRTVTDIMVGEMGMEDIMLTPGIDNLNIINSGAVPPNPSELLTSPRIGEFISQVEKDYDVVIFDSAPILPATDAAILGTKLDGVVIVYQVGRIARGALKRAKVQLDNVKANVLGVVLNGLRAEISPDFQDFKYEKYYIYDSESKTKKEETSKVLSFIKSFWDRIFKKGEKKEAPDDRKRERLKKPSSTAKKILVTLLALLFLTNGLVWQKNIFRLEPFLVTLEKSIQKLKILTEKY